MSTLRKVSSFRRLRRGSAGSAGLSAVTAATPSLDTYPSYPNGWVLGKRSARNGSSRAYAHWPGAVRVLRPCHADRSSAMVSLDNPDSCPEITGVVMTLLGDRESRLLIDGKLVAGSGG